MGAAQEDVKLRIISLQWLDSQTSLDRQGKKRSHTTDCFVSTSLIRLTLAWVHKLTSVYYNDVMIKHFNSVDRLSHAMNQLYEPISNA